MKKGLLIVLSGPSGVGKGTVREIVFNDTSLNLVYSISATTRSPRATEVNGRDYFFITREEFENKMAKGEFLETAQFVGNYYGTPKDYVEKLREEGKNVFLEIEVQGAKQVLDIYKDDPRVVSIFLLPPSLEELEKRIRGRRSEPEEIVQQRLGKAKGEINLKDSYQYSVVNVDIENSADQIKNIIKENL